MTIYQPNDLSSLQAAFTDADGDPVWFKSINGQIINWAGVSQVDVPLLGGTLRIFRYGASNPPVFIGADNGQNGPAEDQTLTGSVAVVLTDGVHDTAGTLQVSVYGRPVLPFGFATQPAVTPAGTVAVGSPLTGTPGTLEGGTTPYSVSYQWKKSGAAISGATAASYTPVGGDSGAPDLYLEVTATDSSMPVKTVSARTNGVAVTTTPLVNTSPPQITGAPVSGVTLSASTGIWTGLAPITFAYQWTNDGVNIAGATASTLLLTVPMEGHSIAVKVTATDGAAATLTRTSGAVLVAASGIVTFETQEAEMMAEFAKHPDNAWAGFPDESGFTVTVCTTPDQVTAAWNAWKNGSPATSKVKVLCQWNGILDAATTRWTGPAKAKLTVNAAEFGGHDRGPGGFWMAKAPGYSPIWGTRLWITGATRMHVTGIAFAGLRQGLQASANPMLMFDYNGPTAPGPAVLFFEDMNIGHKDNRPGAPYSDMTTGLLVKQGSAYSARYKNCRFAGVIYANRSHALYNYGWKTDFQDTIGDMRMCLGINDGRFAGRYIWNYWELTMTRDLRQEPSAAGYHTDNMQQGGAADTHKGYKTCHKYFLANMDSHVAIDSQTQGFYNDDAVNGQEFHVSMKEGVCAVSAYHAYVKYDPSRMGHARLKRLMFPRASTWGLDKAGAPMDTYQQVMVSHGGANGGSFAADHVSMSRLTGGSVGEAVTSNIRFFNAQKNTPAGRDGLTQANAMRIEEFITGTGGSFARDGADLATYSIPGESNPDFAAAWWALRDFYTPVAGWGTAGVPTDPGTWPGVPPRP